VSRRYIRLKTSTSSTHIVVSKSRGDFCVLRVPTSASTAIDLSTVVWGVGVELEDNSLSEAVGCTVDIGGSLDGSAAQEG
jgi:hypothetical protein